MNLSFNKKAKTEAATTAKPKAVKAKATRKSQRPIILSNMEQLLEFINSKSKERVVLSGSLVGGAVGSAESLSGMVVLAPRDAKRQSFLSSQKPRKLYIGVERDAVTALLKSRQKVSLAIDALIKYGQKVRADEVIVISMSTGLNATGVVSLRFRKGEVEELQDFELSDSESFTFEADLIALIDRLKLNHPNAQFHWCGPMRAPAAINMPEAPASIWSGLPAQGLSMSGKASLVQRHGIPVLLVVAAASAAAGALWMPYTRYTAAANVIASDNAQLKGDYTFASERLSLLRALQSFSRSREAYANPLANFSDMIYAAGEIKDLRIKEVRVNWPGSVNDDPRQSFDFELHVEVLKDGETTALEQSVPLLKKLSSATGANMRVATNDGMREIPSTTVRPAQRSYRIQGDFPSGS